MNSGSLARAVLEMADINVPGWCASFAYDSTWSSKRATRLHDARNDTYCKSLFAKLVAVMGRTHFNVQSWAPPLQTLRPGAERNAGMAARCLLWSHKVVTRLEMFWGVKLFRLASDADASAVSSSSPGWCSEREHKR